MNHERMATVTSGPRADVALTPGSSYAGVTRERAQRVEFFSFDQQYVQRLAAGESETERHFVSYFTPLLQSKLSRRQLKRQDVEDLRQETFLRVLCALRLGHKLEKAECLGAYVNGICNNVFLEFLRGKAKASQWDENMPEPRAPGAGIESQLVSDESRRRVRKLIDDMSPKDGGLMRAVFLEERDKDEVCREFGVGRDYLRVLLHRAKKRFRELLDEGKP
jgi:RNA polymerase sigma-70 factor (ECF subfamily)